MTRTINYTITLPDEPPFAPAEWELWKYTVSQDGVNMRDFKPAELWWARMEWIYNGYERQSLRAHFEREIGEDWYAEIESEWDAGEGKWGKFINAYTEEELEDLEAFVNGLKEEFQK